MRIPIFSFVGFCFILAAASSPGTAQEKGKEKFETIKMFYRIKFDAFAPSSFTAPIGMGSTLPLKITWDISEKEKKMFDEVIADLEKKKINGVEFSCKGEWLKKGRELRVTTTPQVTEDGKKRIKEGGR